jgi:hypothetical protein
MSEGEKKEKRLLCSYQNGKWQEKKQTQKTIPIFFFLSEIGNFNIGGPVNQLIKKGLMNVCNINLL